MYSKQSASIGLSPPSKAYSCSDMFQLEFSLWKLLIFKVLSEFEIRI
jgi:hypothetical protein